MQRGPVALLVLACALGVPASAQQVPAARLVYVPGPFADVCPATDQVKRSIETRLGLDPFVEPAERVLLIAIEGGDDLAAAEPRRARIELLDAALLLLGARVIDSSEGCAELIEAAALAASIALAPERVLAVPAPEPSVPAPAPAPIDPAGELEGPLEQPAAPPIEQPRTWSFLPEDAVLLGGLGTSWALLLGPGASVGPTVSVAARQGDLELRAELRSRAGVDGDSGSVHGAMTTSVLPCLHLPLFDIRGDDPIGVQACGSGTAGMVWAVGGYFGLSPYLGSGAQLGLQWVQPDLAALRLWGAVEVAIFRPIYVDLTGGALLDQAAPANVAIGVTWEIPISP